MNHPEIDTLDEYRLRRDYSFLKLSHFLAEVGIEISPRTLHYILKKVGGKEPRDRTLYKFRRFLKLMGVPDIAADGEPVAEPEPTAVHA